MTLVIGLAVITSIGTLVTPDSQRVMAWHAEQAANAITGEDGSPLRYRALRFEGPANCQAAVERKWLLDPSAPERHVQCHKNESTLQLIVDNGTPIVRELPNGWSLAPPLLAIILAFAFRAVIFALLSAVLLAACMATPDIAALPQTTWSILEPSVTSPFNLSIYAFTALLLGMVGIQLRSGGLHAVVERLAKRAKTRESAQVATATMGVAVFFDDYANSVVVGASARPLADRFRISREKLAYIVDSTAAPISGIAVISTWVGYEVSQFNAQLSALEPVASSGYEVFFAILPFRFYCIVSVMMVFVIAATGRDFGPMLRAERRAQTTTPGEQTDGPVSSLLTLSPAKGTPRRWQTGVIPVLTVLASTLIAYGWFSHDQITVIAPWTLTYWQDAFRIVGDMMDGNLGMYILVGAAATGALVATILSRAYGQLSLPEATRSFSHAVWTIGPTLLVLVLAISIRSAVGIVHADWFLVTLVAPMDPSILPLAVFFLAAATAFCTGTSWGTMGILMPVAIPLVADQVSGLPEASIILALSTAAVLDGAIFGDHCSPISDTTVMSSMATGCDHIEHVRTQLPYATVAMFAAALFGYALVASQHTSAVWSWLLAGAFVVIITKALGWRATVPVVPVNPDA